MVRGLLVVPLSSLCFAACWAERRALSVHGPEAVLAADFVVGELRDLSDSGVYRSLTLHRIVSAAAERGVFHDNTFLELELASPHLESGRPMETYDVVVMAHLDDGTRSFAIDEFPAMDDGAVEQYLVEKIERQREQRELSFAKMELDAAAEQVENEDTLFALKASEDLIAALRDAATLPNRRDAARAILEKRAEDVRLRTVAGGKSDLLFFPSKKDYSQDRIAMLVELSKLSLEDLDRVARDDAVALSRRALATELLQERTTSARPGAKQKPKETMIHHQQPPDEL